MTTRITPGTPEWESLREEIVALEAEATEATNAARDALLAQGDLFASIAPASTGRGQSNGTLALLEQMAAECGIAPRSARTRRDLASEMPPGGHLRQMLEEAADVAISHGTLRTILTDDQPEALLARLIEEARAAGSGRITRDAARRLRGLETGTVGTPQATAERIARDPEYARQMAEAVESNEDAFVALAKAQNETDQARTTHQRRERFSREQEAAEGEQVYHLSGFKLMPVLLECSALVEFVEERVTRDAEDVEKARLAGQWLQSLGNRLEAWADGITVPMSDEDFQSGIEALVGDGQ